MQSYIVRDGVRRVVAPHRTLLSFLLKLALLLLCLTSPLLLHAETLSGRVLDPSGAVIVGARIEITGGDLTRPVVLSSDGQGKFSSPDLNPGTYSVRVTRDGFEPSITAVDLRRTAELELKLAIAKQREEVTVSGKGRAYANSDPIYRQLRKVGLGQTYRFDDFTLKLDAATFRFDKGTLTLLTPVNGAVTGAIYVGDGHLHLRPSTLLDAAELKRRSGAPEAE